MRDANFRPVTFCAEESDTEPVSGVPWLVEIHSPGQHAARLQLYGGTGSPYNGPAWTPYLRTLILRHFYCHPQISTFFHLYNHAAMP